MPNLRPGTGQIGITGIPSEMIAEFKALCKGTGQNGRDLSYGELFELMFAAWKKFQANPETGRAIDPWATVFKANKKDVSKHSSLKPKGGPSERA